MVQIFLIALAAGGAAALLFASVASGALLAMILFYLAPLPIMIAALGWSHLSGLIAALVAASGLGLIFGPFFFTAFLFGVGLPAWWLGYLALLARADVNGALEWYPPGRLVVWAAIVGAFIVTVAIVNFGLDEEAFHSGLRAAFERVLRAQTGTAADAPLVVPGVSDAGRLLDVLVAVIPPTAAVLSTLTNLVNLWLAGRIVGISGRLRRPWPELSAMTFPAYAPVLLGLAVAATFAPGLVGVLGGILTASLLMAYAVLGFAVVHALTRGINARGLVLGGIYGAVILFGWPMLAMTLLGLAETAFGFRGRIGQRPPPPATHT